FRYFSRNSQIFGYGYHRLGTHPIYQLGGNGIYRIGQGIFKGKHFPGIFTIGILRAPKFWISMFIGLNTILIVREYIAGRKSQLIYSGSIYKRFKGRSYLPGPLDNVVILKMLIIYAPYPGLYMSRLRFHGHHGRLEKGFIIPNGIHRGHYRILFLGIAIPIKNRHLYRFVKGSPYFLFTLPQILEIVPSVRGFYGPLHNTCYFSWNFLDKGSCFITIRGVLMKKLRLQPFHMFGH